MEDTGQNVILLMFDGLRWREFFQDMDKELAKRYNVEYCGQFSRFWDGDLSKKAAIIGNRNIGSKAYVKREPTSLPAYATIHRGKDSGFNDNDDGRVNWETIGERIKRKLNLNKGEVAVISSWDTIKHAVESTKGTIFTNCGFKKYKINKDKSEIKKANRNQFKNKPTWRDGSRLDKYTWTFAMDYLEKKPRFMFISLNDSDGSMHYGMPDVYFESCDENDLRIEELFEKLENMGEYGKNTTVLITTDHGRGEYIPKSRSDSCSYSHSDPRYGSSRFNGIGFPPHGHVRPISVDSTSSSSSGDWQHHSRSIYGSMHIWFVAKGPKIKQKGSFKNKHYADHTMIRPLIEICMGLDPMAKPKILDEFVKAEYLDKVKIASSCSSDSSLSCSSGGSSGS